VRAREHALLLSIHTQNLAIVFRFYGFVLTATTRELAMQRPDLRRVFSLCSSHVFSAMT
jgi:hypothetical protein